MSKIYRFISFEAFMDMLVKQSLTFVHPSVWDDPYELKLFESNFSHVIELGNSLYEENTLGAILEHIITKKIFCQSWTKLDESDALWKTYNHHNTSVRIEVDLNNISKLDTIEVLDVEYVDDFNQVSAKINTFYDMIRIKRKAFSHEHELRLVTHYRFRGTEDARGYLSDFLKLSGDSRFYKNINIEDIHDEVDRIVSKLNYNLKEKTVQIYYGNINSFIESVMLNPFAPDWFDNTLKMICEQFEIKYLGKSKLYKIDQ